MGYQLLDMLAWVNNSGQGSMGPQLPRVAISIAPHERLDRLLSFLADWPAIMPKVQHLASERSQEVGQQTLTFQSSVSTEWKRTITNLIQTSQQRSRAEWHKILTNIYSMAFIIHWFSMVIYLISLNPWIIIYSVQKKNATEAVEKNASYLENFLK